MSDPERIDAVGATAMGGLPWPRRGEGVGDDEPSAAPQSAASQAQIDSPQATAAPDVAPKSVAPDAEPQNAAPEVAPRKSRQPRPGSIAFPLGSGAGQFLLALCVGAVCVIAWAFGSYAALQALAAIGVVCGFLRLTLPGTKFPSLVNRGRGFDVGTFFAGAAAIEILILFGPEL